jgi:membrane protein
VTPGPRDFVRALWHKYREDHVAILVSSLAYYTFFSFFPILLLLASIIGFVYGTGAESVQLPRQVLDLFPFSSEFMSDALDRIIHARHSLGFFGSVLLIWSATGAFDNLQQILNRIHRAPAMRPLWRRRLLGVLLGLILTLFIPLSMGISAVRSLPARTLAGIVFNFVLLLTLYHFGPSVRRRYRQIWPGALAGAVLWEVSKALFRIYVGSLSAQDMPYGSVGSVIAVLLWLYVSGTIFALGAEINFVIDHRRELLRRAPV